MLIDGEKWACEACVRGHRVSNCQHHDRPLQHINKKGRPVSQCQHCRAMRKSRSSHVKCDCGEKTHKCVHLKTTVEGHKDSCCCNHGGRCTCSHKKDVPQLDRPESDSDKDAASHSSASRSSKAPSRIRRRAHTTNSDGTLAFDANGHHKPTYKHAKASQKSGPYQITRVNSMHSASNMGSLSPDDFTQGSGESAANDFGGMTEAQHGISSECTSPLMTGSSSLAHLNGQLPPLDLSGITFPSYVPNSADFFGNMSDHEQPIFSAGLSAGSVDWSHYDGLEFSRNAEFAPSSYSQPQSYGGFDFSGPEQLPTLTANTSTSGEVSEVEDFMPNPLDEFDAVNAFRSGATAGLGFSFAHQADSLDASGLDLHDFKNKFLPTPSSHAGDEPSLLPGGFGSFAPLDEDPLYWMGDEFSGLPNLNGSPGEANLQFHWEGQ